MQIYVTEFAIGDYLLIKACQRPGCNAGIRKIENLVAKVRGSLCVEAIGSFGAPPDECAVLRLRKNV